MEKSDLPDPAEMFGKEHEMRNMQLFMSKAEERLRQLAAKHSLNWDEMSEDRREQFIDSLLHEEL